MTHHEQEWAEMPHELSSRYAYVTITRDATWPHLYRLTGGRLGRPVTWSAVLPSCKCERPSCPRSGRVRGYARPSYAVRPNDQTQDFGRSHTRSSHGRSGGFGYCHGVNGYNPADVLGLARAALATWSKPAPVAAGGTR